MTTTPRTVRLSALVLASLTTASVLLATPARADGAVGEVIARDSAPAPAPAGAAQVVGVDADIVAGLSITGHRGKLVTLTAKGQPARSATARAASPVVFRNLSPGTAYTVSIGGIRVGTGTPLAQPGAAYALTVATTEQLGQVQLAWKQQARPGQGAVHYRVTATPASSTRSSAAVLPVTVESDAPSVTVAGLDTAALYTFTVTPVNTAAQGRASAAAMARTLADLGAGPAIAPVPIPAPSVPAPAPAPGAAPAPAPAPVPAPARPSTRTIYVCPTGFTDTGTLCRKATAYTWDVKDYTYHAESYTYTAYGAPYTVRASEIAPGPTCAAGWGPAWDHDPVLGSVNAHCEQTRQDPYTATGSRDVKDAMPAGYTDTGGNWTKKNPIPAGYTDDGAQWVTDTAKVATEVAA